MSAAQAQTALNSGFAVDWTVATSAGGSYFAKNGLWENGSGQLEQGVSFYLPEDMELVVLVNSPVTSTGEFLYSVVSNVYLSNLV